MDVDYIRAIKLHEKPLRMFKRNRSNACDKCGAERGIDKKSVCKHSIMLSKEHCRHTLIPAIESSTIEA